MAITRTGIIDQRMAPVTMANGKLVAVPDPLVSLFPAGGLQQGWSVGFAGRGGWSLAMALLGAAVGSTGWAACVGMEDLGLVAADELGLQLDRVLLVETPEAKQLAAVVAALIEAVDVVCVGSTASVGTREARRLMARAREQNVVLFHLDGGRSWPQPLDVVLTGEVQSWSGLGEGQGRLQARSMLVTAAGRRSMAKPRHVAVQLPGPTGGVEPAVTASPSVTSPARAVPAVTSPARAASGRR